MMFYLEGEPPYGLTPDQLKWCIQDLKAVITRAERLVAMYSDTTVYQPPDAEEEMYQAGIRASIDDYRKQIAQLEAALAMGDT